MRRFALTLAILGFFVLAGVGLASDVPTFDSALRGLGGAMVIYFVVAAAGKLALKIMVDAVIDSLSDRENERTQE